MKTNSNFRRLLILAASPLLGATNTSAQSNWVPTAEGATYDWQTPGNWSTDPTIPNGTAATANLINNIAGAQTVNLNGAVTLGTLNIGDSDSSHAFTLANGTGGSLTLNNGGSGASFNKTGTITDIISASITLADNFAVNVGTGGTLSQSGTISEISGARSFTKTGAGIYNFSGASTHTGSTVISEGELRMGSTNHFASSMDIRVAGGATLRLSNAVSSSFFLASGQGITGTGTGTVKTSTANNQ